MTDFTSRRVRASGVSLHWVEAGQGPPLVLLHGLGDTHRTWRHVIPTLARHRRVYALDLPGHGLSERPDASYDLGWHALTVGQWTDYLELDAFDLVGHSFGGGVAQFLLLSHAANVRRLALVSSGGLGREVHPALRLIALPLTARVMQPFMRLGTAIGTLAVGGRGFVSEERRWLSLINAVPGSARAFARTVRGVIGVSGQTVHFLDHARHIAALPPIRLFWGDKDPVIPWKHGIEALDYLSDVRLVRIPGAGHFPHLAEPDLFAAELLAFLGDPTAKPARLAGAAAPPIATQLRALQQGLQDAKDKIVAAINDV